MSSLMGIWTGWNNAGFCSFFTKKEPKKFQTKMHLLMVSRCFFIAGGGVLDAPRADMRSALAIFHYIL